MKRYTLYTILLLISLSLQAQTKMRIWQAGENTKLALTDAGDMTFNGSSLTIAGQSYALSAIDSIVIVPQVTVTYEGNTASVSIPPSVAKDVTAEVNGADVTITNRNVSNECEFLLSGNSTNGSLTYYGEYKATFILDGLDLTSTTGSPFNIQCGKRIGLELKAGTSSHLSDAANGIQKACLYCRGHLEIEGNGNLFVTGNRNHGISSKEYMQLKKTTGQITILKAANDAVHAGQYFQMNGGTLTYDSNTASDGIQVETLMLDDGITPDPTEEMNGQIIIKGGTIRGTIVSQDCKGIKCDSTITISGGDIQLTAQGNGSRGIQTDGNMTISEAVGSTTLIDIKATGARCTLEECAEDPHRCMGIKVEGNLTITGGTTNVVNTGSKSRGIKVDGTYTKTGGTVNATITTI